MNYEKKYQEALERAKEALLASTAHGMFVIQEIFPELKGSEDEKIRKEIMQLIQCMHDADPRKERWIAWLEKQGKQKPADMVEPKLHEGDWIISNNKKSTYQVIEVKRGIYVIRDNADNHVYHIGIEECEKSGRLWSISDAKDGDILVMAKDCSPFIFKGFDQFHPECPVAYGGIDEDDEFIPSNGTGWWDDGGIHPATKEQRDLLFSKIKEAGYEWNTLTKKIKRITKFKIGDKVHCGDENQPVTIVDITNDSYITDSMIGSILFSEEDNWTLIKHKFKVDDWVVKKDEEPFANGNYYAQITDIDVEQYWFDNGTWLEAEDIRLWSIADAKDGDVLASGQVVFIFKVIRDAWLYCHCSVHNDGSLIAESYDMMTYKYFGEVHPATKEQRDLLFSKIKEAGYEWNAEKKELKKMEATSKESEDERIRKELIAHCRNTRCVTEEGAEQVRNWIAWLEKQGEQPTDKIEPKKLDPDKVIEWLNDQACLGWIEDVEIDKFIEKFKKDFGL